MEQTPREADRGVTLVREHRDYHWSHGDDGWDYDFTRRYEEVQTRTVEVGESAVRLHFPVEWGDYRIDVHDPATRLTTRYPFRAGWSWNDDNRGLDARPDKVKLALDKTAYRAGDTLQVTLTPPHAGKGLLMVESDRMLYVQAIDAKPGSTFSIPVTKEWERHDIYVTALVFRGGSAPSKITPARAVGVVHVPMDRRDRRVAVGLSVPKQMRPEQNLPVTVSVPELAGQLAHVTVSAVDVGILNITRFPVPDANAQFFAQRRFGVDAYDIYGRVIESFEGGSAKIRFGGDMALSALPQAKRPTSRVQTVDLFSGPVKLDGKGNARVALKVPDFNGTLRVSALVYSDTRYGNRDRETVVRAPIVAEASLPRVLAPGDRSTVTLDVQMTKTAANTWSVKFFNPADATTPVGTATVAFDGNGKVTSGGSTLVQVPNGREIKVDLGGLTQLSGDHALSGTADGSSPTSVSGTAFGEDGTVYAVYSDGTRKAAFKVPLADVASPDNLTPRAGNVFTTSAESGDIQIGFAGQGGRGIMKAGALEQSNVDVSTELTTMIESQTVYTANSKVFMTGNELLETLMNLKR